MKQQKISNNLIQLNATELFKTQVRNNIDKIRYQNRGMSYTPVQFGGLSGQRFLMSEPSVMEIIDFEVTDE